MPNIELFTFTKKKKEGNATRSSHAHLSPCRVRYRARRTAEGWPTLPPAPAPPPSAAPAPAGSPPRASMARTAWAPIMRSDRAAATTAGRGSRALSAAATARPASPVPCFLPVAASLRAIAALALACPMLASVFKTENNATAASSSAPLNLAVERRGMVRHWYQCFGCGGGGGVGGGGGGGGGDIHEINRALQEVRPFILPHGLLCPWAGYTDVHGQATQMAYEATANGLESPLQK